MFPERLEPEEEWRGDADTEGKREEEEAGQKGPLGESWAFSPFPGKTQRKAWPPERKNKAAMDAIREVQRRGKCRAQKRGQWPDSEKPNEEGKMV